MAPKAWEEGTGHGEDEVAVGKSGRAHLPSPTFSKPELSHWATHADKQGLAGVELQVQEEEERDYSKHVTVSDTGSLLAVTLSVRGLPPLPAMSQGPAFIPGLGWN